MENSSIIGLDEFYYRQICEIIATERSLLARYLAKVDLLTTRVIVFIPKDTKKGDVEIRYDRIPTVEKIIQMYEQRWQEMIDAYRKNFWIENPMTIETQQD